MTLNNRIKQIRELLVDNSNTIFAEKLSVKKQAASNYVRDGYNVGREVIEKILNAFPMVDANWLLTGDGEMEKNVSMRQINNVIEKPFIDSVYASCGVPNGFNVAVMKGECENLYIPFIKEYDFSIRAKGDSMINHDNPNRSICPGDVVACKFWSTRNHIRWGEVYALSTTEGVIIKKLLPSERDGFIKCVSYNDREGFPPFEIPVKDVYDWAIVVGTVSVNQWG